VDVYHVLAWAAVGYYLLIYTAHLLHLVMGRAEVLKWKIMGYSEEAHRLSRGMKVPPLTLVADMRKVTGDHVTWADRLLSQRFPRLELILLYPRWEEEALKVVEAFYLRQLDFVYRRQIEAPPPLAVFRSEDRRLVLVRAPQAGEGDLLNMALNLSRYPLLGVVSGGVRLEADALLRLVKPFMEGEEVTAAAGMEWPLEDEDGWGIPSGRMTRFAFMESLRTQLGYLAGTGFLGGPCILFGSLVIYRRRDLLDAGGFRPLDSIPEVEADATLRLHRLMRERRRSYRVVFLPRVVLRRAFPRTWREYLREYRQGMEAVGAALRNSRDILFRPLYGSLGMLQLPVFWLNVRLAPFIGFCAHLACLACFAAGKVGWPPLAAFLGASTLLPGMVGAGAVAVARRELGLLRGQGILFYAYAFLAQVWFRQSSIFSMVVRS